MTSFLPILLLSASAMAQAKPVETWECRDRFANNWKSILVTATVDSSRREGSIAVAGITQQAAFRVQGFDRRWDFGLKADGGYQYAFIIEPNGDAAYYDFGKGGTAKPSNFMTCRQTD